MAEDRNFDTPMGELSLDSQELNVKKLNDELALARVMATYNRWRNYRYRNHDTRWNTNDALYMGWMPTQYWEGTRVPRAQIGSQIVFDQVEAALPVVSNALFGDSDWFEVDPLPGTSLEEARHQKERLMYLLETPRDKLGTNARTQVHLALKQLLLYGNGYVNVEYDGGTQEPTVNWVDIRDIYLDPACNTPTVDDGRGTIILHSMTADQIDSMRGIDGISLPSREGLKLLAMQGKPIDTGDFAKQQQEAFRGVSFNLASDTDTDILGDKTIEVMIYQSDSQIVWILNRRWVMYNEQNPYGFMTLCGAPCFIVTGRHYAMGFGDALEYNQKYIQRIMCGRLDELSLALDPPRAKKRGATMTAAQSRIRPGLVMEFENPKDDVVFLPPQNVTQNGWQEIQYLEGTAEKRTGVTSMITQGTPIRSNASRTATGIQAQQSGPTTRLQHIVEMVENYLIVPMLIKMLAIDAYHSGEGQQLKGMAVGGSSTHVPSNSMAKPTRFRIKAASKMLTQGRLQSIIPFMAQYLLNGPFLAQLQKTGQTVDFSEFARMLQDATGTRDAYKIFRPMNQQEQQAAAAPPPQVQAKMQSDQLNAKVRTDIADKKLQGDMARLQQEKDTAEEKNAIEIMKMIHDINSAQQGGNEMIALVKQLLNGGLGGGGGAAGGAPPPPSEGEGGAPGGLAAMLLKGGM